MLLAVKQANELLAKHGVFAREICDKCGAVLEAVRFTRRNESGVWRSGECRGDGERQKVHRGGRPSTYKDERTRKNAHAQQQRDSRLRSSVTKTCQHPNESEGLAGTKTPLSTIPLTPMFPALETAERRLVTVHGLVDSLYVRELAKKTHRGMEGLALRGLHTGGRIFGYDTVSLGEGAGKKLVVNPSEASIVKRIFELSACGHSLKAITRTLNVEHVPSPRPREDRVGGEWCPTAIREMLKNELYIGNVVWNRSKFVRCRERINDSGDRVPNLNGCELPIPGWPLSLLISGRRCAHDLRRSQEFGAIQRAVALRRAP